MAVMPAWWDGRDLRALLPKVFFEHFRGTSLLVEHEDGLIGFLVGFFCPDHADEAYVHFVGVDPAWRRVGLARDLYRRFFGLARAHGPQRRPRRHRPGQRAARSPSTRRSGSRCCPGTTRSTASP